MSDDVNDDRSGSSDELAALSAVRDALEAVERQQGRAIAERQWLKEQWDSLLSGLRADAVVMSFDRDGKLEEIAGPVEDFLGMEPGEAVDNFDDLFADEEREEIDKANRRVLSQRAGVVSAVADVESRGGSHRLGLIHIAITDTDGRVVGVEVIGRDVGGGEQATGLSETQERFEELLRDTSQRFLDSRGGGAMTKSLAALGELFEVDRVVANGYDEDGRKFSALASWHREGVEALEAETAGISISELPWAYSVLGAGEAVVISEGADLPREAEAEKALYATEDVRCALLVPMVRRDSLAGFVSIQAAKRERTWSDAEIVLARQFVSVVSGALVRATLVEELEAARRDAADAVDEAAVATREIEESKAAETQARQQLEDLSAAAAASSARVDELEAELEGLHRELGEAREAAGTADAVVEEAKASADEARDGLAEVRAELDDARRELDSIKGDADRAQRRAEDTAADALAVRQELEKARSQIEEARHEAAEARRQIRERHETEPAIATEELPAVEPPGDMETAFEAEVSVETDETTAEQESVPAGGVVDEDERADEEETIVVPGLAKSIADAGGFDPDATVEFRKEALDPDATLEIEPVKLKSAEDESPDETAPDGDPQGEEIDLGATVELPRALGLNEILERTQAVISDEEGDDPSVRETVEVSQPSFLGDRGALPDHESEAAASEDRDEEDAEAGGSEDHAIARDVEAARQLARRVAGKDSDEEEASDFDADEDAAEKPEIVFESDMTGEFVAAQMESEQAEADPEVDAEGSEADDPIASGSQWSFGSRPSKLIDQELEAPADAESEESFDAEETIEEPIDFEPEVPADEVAEEAFDADVEAIVDDEPDDDVAADEEIGSVAEPEPASEEEVAEIEPASEETVAEPEPASEEKVAEPVGASAPTTGLVGFDTAAGVAEVGGNAELYGNLLSKFRQDYVGAADKIGAAIEKGNVEIAHLLLNAVKGVAGVLGAGRVHVTADELETALIGGNLAVTRGAHGQFSAALAEALDSIAGLDAGAELIIAPAGGPEEHVSDPQVLRSYLEGLRQHLEARKRRPCQLMICEITARTWPGEINSDVDELARSIRDERFEEAQETFDKLISKLED